jgi:mono/diheme cytochrome c family protein
MVQTRVETAKVSLDAAESYVKSQTGLKVSMFDNFIAQRATSAEYKKAGDVARRLVLSIQKSKENSTSSTSSQCTSGLSNKEAEHVKESHINEGLIGNLDTIRKESDAHENESDDDARRSTVVVPVCGSPATPAPAPAPAPGPTPAPAPTPTPTPAPAPSASPTSGKALYAANCAACHGANPTTNGNKILNGANSAGTITGAISRNTGGMGFLSATIGATQAADLAAYLATPGI